MRRPSVRTRTDAVDRTRSIQVNYPHLVQPGLTTAALGDASCSGATTDDMFNAQSTSAGTNPPQLNALTADTRVVTLGIGGNDIGFTDIVLNCARLNPFDPCKDDYVHGSTDDISVRIAATAPKVDAVIAAIHARSPSAKVHVVGYPTILPATGSGCWPSVPILPTDVTYLRAKEFELNAMLAARAAADGRSTSTRSRRASGTTSARAPRRSGSRG
jgi:hypothetical protein